MNTTVALLVQPIDPTRLDDVRRNGADGHGNRLGPLTAAGRGEPLRCCLRYAEAGEQITLMSYAPFDHPSVWTEVGPVYIHAERCDGYEPMQTLPTQLTTGPRLLRTYRADDTMNYDHNTVVTDETDLKPIIERLLVEPDVATVHVRNIDSQCFLYSVSAAPDPGNTPAAANHLHDHHDLGVVRADSTNRASDRPTRRDPSTGAGLPNARRSGHTTSNVG